MMKRQFHHLVRLVDDLLDVSRIITGRVDLRKEHFDLTSAITRAVETAEPLIDARGHQLIQSPPGEPITVFADVVRLSQVVSNLLINAAKYADKPGRIWLHVEKEGGDVVIRVKDEGIGMAPEMLERVFDLFVQADASAKRAQGGLGIGLTLVKRIIELHEGVVTAHSPGIGQGSEFIVRFPAEPRAMEELPGPADSPAREANPEPGERRVLIVDDNVDAAESIAIFLESAGFSTRCVYDGVSALLVASAYKPNAVVLDIGLPDITGYEVARRLRSQPEFERTPIIAVTGYGQHNDRRRAHEAGINHHMTKPVDPDALVSMLAAFP